MSTGNVRTAAFLFADIAGSTIIAEALQGPDESRYNEFSSSYEELMKSTCGRFDGMQGGLWGDDFFAVFNAAEDAIKAALAVHEAAASRAWPGGVGVNVRIGLHWGRVVQNDGGFIGLNLHRAARICSFADGRQTVVSAGYLDQLAKEGSEPKYQFQDLGPQRLRNLATPERLLMLEGQRRSGTADALPGIHFDEDDAGLLPLIGRDREVARVRELLGQDSVRLITITGTGGVGKTRLMTEVGLRERERFADGVITADLSLIQSADQVTAAIAEAVGLDVAESEPDLAAITAHLAGRRGLLMVDNFEHVREAASVLGELLASLPKLKILTTSRESLELVAEQQFPLEPLGHPSGGDQSASAVREHPATRLFEARVRRARPDFQIGEQNAAAVVEICRHLDGIPLAIELAAPRLKYMSAAELAAQLRERPLTQLRTSLRDVPPRQQTMEGVIQWSYRNLGQHDEVPASPTEALQRLFCEVSVFAGGFNTAAALGLRAQVDGAAVDPTHAEVLTGHLEQLADSGLVQAVVGSSGEVRFRLLHVIREFGWQKLAEAGVLAEVRSAHLSYFAEVAQKAELTLQGSDQMAAVESLGTELDNLRDAVRWSLESDVEKGLGLAASLVTFWWHQHLEEGLAWIERLLNAGPELSEQVTVPAHLTAAFLALYSGKIDDCGRHVEACLRAGGDHPRVLAVKTVALGLSGMVASAQGRLAEGLAATDQSVKVLAKMPIPWLQAVAQNWRGDVAIRAGQPALAEESWQASVELLETIGDQWLIAAPIARLADLAYEKGDYRTARARLNESVEIWRNAGVGSGTAQVLASLARLSRAEGQQDLAAEYARESITAAHEAGSLTELDLGLSVAAALSSDEEDFETAAKLLGAADALRGPTGQMAAPFVIEEDRRLSSTVRKAIGSSPFDEAFATGQSMGHREAVALALSEAQP